MPKISKMLVSLFASCFFANFLYAQKDTQFWFAAPEISNGGNGGQYDTPVRFVFSTYGQAATVTLTQPANNAFPARSVSLAPNTSGFFDFPPDFQFVENTSPNQVLSKGFLLESTVPISVYYEAVGGVNQSNPEICSMKGRNALGNVFYVPFQTKLDNSAIYSPLPTADFVMVASENNTNVTITPTQDLTGHIANAPFSISLNRGQSYCCQSASQAGSQHPSGTKVVSDKPIAITMKDDLLEATPEYPGGCRDILADQIVPVEKVGKQYVVQKGFLFGPEFAYVVGTASNTQVFKNGALAGTVNAGQTLEITIDAGNNFIESTAPVYVLQLTGNGCEVSGEVLPSLECSGSLAVRFVKSQQEPFWLFLVTRSGNEGNFKLNGNPGSIQSGDFSAVPGSGGSFVSSVIEFSESTVATGVSSLVENTAGVFQMGFLNGQVNATGCRFGFFSDFGKIVYLRDSIQLCQGDTLIVHGIKVFEEGVFSDTITTAEGCDTIATITIFSQEFISDVRTLTVCRGDSVLIGNVFYKTDAILVDTLPANIGCDTVSTIHIEFDKAESTFLPSDTSICAGDKIVLHSAYMETTWNASAYGQDFTVFDPRIVTATALDANGCLLFDTLVVGTCCADVGVFVPNVFSPETTGGNNEFKAFYKDGCQYFNLWVYDRWGELLFYSEDPDKGWDGTARQKPCHVGVYVWVMEVFLGNGEKVVKQGNVTLIR